MTELRKRMIESLQLRGLSERTQEAYVRAVRQLSDHYHKSPDLISEEELRQYFLHIKNVKKYSRASSTIAICGIKFFFEKTLNREVTTFKLVRVQREKKLPVILSVEEVLAILERVRLPRYRVCLSTIYSCGLRLQEGTHVGVRDIDSARGILHVRHGKGGKDRYVPLPERTLEMLREYWVTHRNPTWIFPSEGKDHIALKDSTEPIRAVWKKATRRSLWPHRLSDQTPKGRRSGSSSTQTFAAARDPASDWTRRRPARSLMLLGAVFLMSNNRRRIRPVQ